MPVLKSFYPYPITLDGDEVVLRLKRFTDGDAQAFAPMWRAIMDEVKLRYAVRRADEMERGGEKGEYLLSLNDIADRRIQEMTAEQRTAYRIEEEKAEEEARTLITEAIKRWVTVERGLSEETADGREQSLTTGEDFLRYYGGRWMLLSQIVANLAAKNAFGDDQKKVSSSPTDSASSSAAPKDRGRKRKMTAARAGTKASAKTAAASPPTPAEPSGSTATSSPPRVPSVN